MSTCGAVCDMAEVQNNVTARSGSRVRIPDEIRKAVCFVAVRLAGGEFRFVGTAFLIGRPFTDDPHHGFVYTVTARHVVDGARDLGYDRLFLRGTSHAGEAIWWETKLADWLLHPAGPAADVALLRSAPEGSHFEIKVLPISMIATAEVLNSLDLGPGDEVAIVGLFTPHTGSQRNIPVVRIGNIAAVPEEPIATELGPMDAFLIEARSIGGLSGSPVLIGPPAVRKSGGNLFIGTGPDLLLLGLMHGHFDVSTKKSSSSDRATNDEARINVGIGIVVPAPRIAEILALPEVREAESAIEAQVRLEANS